MCGTAHGGIIKFSERVAHPGSTWLRRELPLSRHITRRLVGMLRDFRRNSGQVFGVASRGTRTHQGFDARMEAWQPKD
jgi:hypothetical protein